MAHELTFKKSADGSVIFDAEGKPSAYMIYRKTDGASLPWHGFGKGYEREITIDDVKGEAGLGRTISLVDLVTHDGFRIPDRRAAFDSLGHYLGTVGGEYTPANSCDLVDSLAPWVDAGFAEWETAGLLKDGSREWVQLRIRGAEFEVRPGDTVKSYLMACQGHDMTLSVRSGYCNTRAVCNNTVSMALSEGGFLSVKHRRADMRAAMVDMQTELLKMKSANERLQEAFQVLARTSATEDKLSEFLSAIIGKDAGRRGGPADRFRLRFVAGIGNGGGTLWDAYNSVTEDSSHGLGNNMKSDRPGDREGRALDRLFFGQGNKLNAIALRAALNIASGQSPDARVKLADLGMVA